jgi:membrane-bound serine protease (ClpP class)
MRLRALLAVLTLAPLLSAPPPASGADQQPLVQAIKLDAEINPVTAQWVKDSINRAQDDHAAALVILLDTPGGLSTSMDDIVQAELASKVPVIVYVSPAGARAASAGVFVTMASDVAAMAPATNIGSATPIDQSGQNLGSDLRRKVLNDAEKKVQTLAETHGRNADAAVLTVSKAANYTAAEAEANGLVDELAPTLPDLLNKISGTTTTYKHLTLDTANAHIVTYDMPLTQRLLNILIDPNLLFLLFLLGIAGLAYEVFHPGVILPGTIGAVSLLLALFGFSIVPINLAGVLLIVLGVALLITEAWVTSHGLIAVSGIIALTAGALLLFRTPSGGNGVSPWVALTIAVLLGGGLALAATKVLSARRQPVSGYVTGPQGLVGRHAEVRSQLLPEGQVFVDGALWEAELEGAPVAVGETVVVTGVQGLTLRVTRVDEATASSSAEGATQ